MAAIPSRDRLDLDNNNAMADNFFSSHFQPWVDVKHEEGRDEERAVSTPVPEETNESKMQILVHLKLLLSCMNPFSSWQDCCRIIHVDTADGSCPE